ncbi:acyl-CoA Delta-9 desaturase isoform X2 [Osmia lignaria lignaria]|uniref:acyl-CoA Delta-9 desaturase isoform X2 n=1 Tax=Osmia lignaria lignaria TaxID=1437193 RepID=UPI00402BD7D8
MYSSTVTQYEEKKEVNGKVEVDVEPLALPAEESSASQPIIWRNVIGIIVLHFLPVYGFVNGYRDAKFWTWIWSIAYGLVAGVGVTAGAHRLWAHRSYSAKVPLRIFLAYLYCMAGQTHFYKWIRDHRTHHRYTETTADPHDARRGFFFSHIGWLMVKRHPSVKKYGSKIDMTDVASDSVIKFYDKRVKPTENAAVSFFALGEGWHNYHHSFPWDYKAAELGAYSLNPTTAFIELMARVGFAYNLKTPSKVLVDRTIMKKGDGTDSLWGHQRH